MPTGIFIALADRTMILVSGFGRPMETEARLERIVSSGLVIVLGLLAAFHSPVPEVTQPDKTWVAEVAPERDQRREPALHILDAAQQVAAPKTTGPLPQLSVSEFDAVFNQISAAMGYSLRAKKKGCIATIRITCEFGVNDHFTIGTVAENRVSTQIAVSVVAIPEDNDSRREIVSAYGIVVAALSPSPEKEQPSKFASSLMDGLQGKDENEIEIGSTRYTLTRINVAYFPLWLFAHATTIDASAQAAAREEATRYAVALSKAAPRSLLVPQASGPTTDLHRSLVSGERVDVVKVWATDLFREYEQNEVATDMRLKGKIIEIRGQVTGVNKDFLDNAYVELKTPNRFMSATVHPIESDIDKIARLRKGQEVTFRCKSMQRWFGSPSGSNCVLMGY